MTNLFTYGSLMCSDIMAKVSSCQSRSIDAVLKDYLRLEIRNREYPGILPHPGGSVAGVVYFDLGHEAILRLDAFEGDMYHRQEVEVFTPDCVAIKAMTYVMHPAYRHHLTDKEWSFAEFLNAGKASFEKSYFGFDEV